MTPTALHDFIQSYRRVTGHLPRWRECVDQVFEGKLLTATMCLNELTPDQAAELRQAARRERELKRGGV